MNRYAQRVSDVGEKMRASREIASMLMAGVDFDQTSEVDKLINESIRTIVFDVVTDVAAGDEPVSGKLLKDLALTSKRLQEAAAVGEKREREIKRKAAEDLVDKAAAGGGAITPEQLRNLVREVYGA